MSSVRFPRAASVLELTVSANTVRRIAHRILVGIEHRSRVAAEVLERLVARTEQP